jgi:hypothetical protein
MLAGLALVAGTAAAAATATVEPTASAQDLALAIARDDSLVVSAEFVAVPPRGTPHAIARDFAGFPGGEDGAALLTTGDARLADRPNDSVSSGADIGGPNVRGNTDFDVTVLKLNLMVPANANCLLGIDFRFLSEEYPEWVGTAFNDAFIAELDRSTWSTAGSTISAPDNFAFDPAGNPVTINAAGVTSMTAEQAQGTTYDGATPLLTAATPITPGPHPLFLSIFDQGDHIYDSAIVIDDLRVGRVANVATDCKPGAQPVPEGYEYVAVGDSTTTGFSVEECVPDNRELSPYGCPADRPPPAPPYPERIAAAGDPAFDELERVGIWGYGVQEAVAAYEARQNEAGTWEPQLIAAEQADGLVTVSLGINDMEFSDFMFWLKECVTFGWQDWWRGFGFEVKNDECKEAALSRARAPAFQSALDEMFEILETPQGRGATVAVSLYYNAFNEKKDVRFGFDRDCSVTHNLGAIVLGAMNPELRRRAEERGMAVVDLEPVFDGHGVGERGDDQWLFGTECELAGALSTVLGSSFDIQFSWPPQLETDAMRRLQIAFDPHPNERGTEAQANAFLEAIR